MAHENPEKWNNQRDSAEYPITPLWLLLIAGTTLGLAYLMVWGVQNNSLRSLGIGVVFTILMFCFLLIYLFVRTGAIQGVSVPVPETFKTSSFWLINGMLVWGIAAQFGTVFRSDGTTQNILLMQPMAMLSDALPSGFWGSFINVISAPVAEECFFLIAMPLAIIYLLQKQFKLPESVSIISAVSITAVTFAYFHVSYQTMGLFLLSAIFFRFVMNLMYWGDSKLDIFERFDIAPEFVVGAHIANNIITTAGFSAVFMTFLTNPLGILFIGIFGVSAFYWLETMAEKVGVI